MGQYWHTKHQPLHFPTGKSRWTTRSKWPCACRLGRTAPIPSGSSHRRQYHSRKPRDQLHKGDAIELFWDGNLQGDFGINNYNEDDVQLIFTPGSIVGNFDNLYYVNHSGSGNNGNGIEVWSWQTEVGYNLEIRIPWAVLGVQPQSGATFGYAIALSDDDTPGSAEQETQLATTNNPLQQPTGWSNFILNP